MEEGLGRQRGEGLADCRRGCAWCGRRASRSIPRRGRGRGEQGRPQSRLQGGWRGAPPEEAAQHGEEWRRRGRQPPLFSPSPPPAEPPASACAATRGRADRRDLCPRPARPSARAAAEPPTGPPELSGAHGGVAARGHGSSSACTPAAPAAARSSAVVVHSSPPLRSMEYDHLPDRTVLALSRVQLEHIWQREMDSHRNALVTARSSGTRSARPNLDAPAHGVEVALTSRVSLASTRHGVVRRMLV